MSFFLRLTLFLVGATSLGLLLLLSLASSNAPSIDINYTWLLNANILLSMLMIVLTGLLVRKAWIRYKKGVFVGYSMQSSSYLILHNRRIYESRDVKFVEAQADRSFLRRICALLVTQDHSIAVI